MAKSMTSKTNVTKSTKTKVETAIVEEVVDKNNNSITETPESVKDEKATEPRKFVPGDMIPCRCVRPNKVAFYSTKTDTRYEFGGYGDINDVDYSDLLKLKSSKSPILYQPKILIEDEELRRQWARDLQSVSHEYEGIYETEELFEKTPNEFETFLRNASDGVKNLVKLSAANLIKEEKLTDLRLIRIIDDVLGTQYKEFV